MPEVKIKIPAEVLAEAMVRHFTEFVLTTPIPQDEAEDEKEAG